MIAKTDYRSRRPDGSTHYYYSIAVDDAVAITTAATGQCLFRSHHAYDERSAIGSGFASVGSRVRSRIGRLRRRVRSGWTRCGRAADDGGHRAGRRSWTLQEDDVEPVHADTSVDRAGLRSDRSGQPQDDGHVGADDQQHGPERGHFHDRPEHGVWSAAQGQVRQPRLSRPPEPTTSSSSPKRRRSSTP